MMTETQFKEKVLRDLGDLDRVYVLKTQEVSRRGVPDLLICLSGRFVAIELKRDGETATPLQEQILILIQSAGGAAFSTCPALWKNHMALLQEMSRNAA